MSGLASSVQDCVRSLVSAGVGLSATSFREGGGTAGFLLSMGGMLALASAVFWATIGIWPAPAQAREAHAGEAPAGKAPAGKAPEGASPSH